jgi:hypothetical protein
MVGEDGELSGTTEAGLKKEPKSKHYFLHNSIK